MLFHKTGSAEAATDIYKNISSALKTNKRVLWLVSGGSAVPIAVDVLHRLKTDAARLEFLAIMQIDERFGPVGHPDSNWRRLQEAGFFDDKVTFLPILRGKNLQTTRSEYEYILEKVFQKADYKIGLFGIGADGHTAGILPHSEATKDDVSLVIAYETPEFTRITISAKAIEQLDTAVVYAAGVDKEPALKALLQDIPFDEQPAQILKSVKDSHVYNSSLEGEV